jgi:hypothetical protein
MLRGISGAYEKLLAVAQGALIFPDVIEGLALGRFVDFRQVFRTPMSPWGAPQNRHDPGLVWIRRPHLRLSGVARGGDVPVLGCLPGDADYRWDVTYDRNGFRNPVDLDRADVAVIGDSIVEGYYVPQSDLLTSRLAARFGVTVANLGQNGYGPQQELIVLTRFALPLHPRVIVWVFYDGNDLDDIHGYPLLQSQSHVLAHPLSGFWHRSFTRNVLKASRRLLFPCRPNETVRRQTATIIGRNGVAQTLLFKYPGQPLTPRDLDALNQFRAILGEAAERAAADGARLIVAFAPEKFRVYHGIARFDSES